ncbi:hypothetical protein [Geothrix sp.]|jgi:hypothetical protein|uniref:hypothetical protein n=1 Tax=Geothrix sp. TaxID=1962974 RepID=UPI0025B7F47C|nr:hypothetical protein [Geothrix sp.]
MNLEQKLQVMQAASVVFASRIAARAAMAATGKALGIQPPSDDEILKQSVELVLRGLGNRDLWPKSDSPAFHSMNF